MIVSGRDLPMLRGCFSTVMALHMYNNLTHLKLKVSIKNPDIDSWEYWKQMPKYLESLSVAFEMSFNEKIIVIFELLSRYIAESNTIKALKLESFQIFDKRIDNLLAECMLQNSSIKKLTLKNFNNNYNFGDQFFFSLKRRQTRLSHFTLKNSRLSDFQLYYFTAFVRSH